jgi:hypothetical protein
MDSIYRKQVVFGFGRVLKGAATAVVALSIGINVFGDEKKSSH